MGSRNWTSIPVATVLAAMTAGCDTGPSFEYVHLPGTEPAAGANMPFTSAIRVGTGRVVFLAGCLLYTSPSPRDGLLSRMPSSA